LRGSDRIADHADDVALPHIAMARIPFISMAIQGTKRQSNRNGWRRYQPVEKGQVAAEDEENKGPQFQKR